ncbi:MAG TPA: alpha/beta hydrolase-fold protein [Mucilaginibacter sp.]|nr:alpha/beta hydrolase-fold protein [Mucilaginibacter sp.]
MKRILLLLFLIRVSSVIAQDIAGNDIIAGHVDTVQSKILNEKRAVWVRLPKGVNEQSGNYGRYPVVYLLDGPEHFAAVSGIIQYLSEANGNMICPDMIVIGITNTDRTRDLTPTHSKFDFEHNTTDAFKSSGGGEKFNAFLTQELIPYVESKYPAAPYRMLIGHSFGGLTAVNMLINHTGIFDAYAIIDPSMWWDDHKLLKQAGEVLKQKKFAGKRVFMGIANTMPPGDDTARAHRENLPATDHIRSILNLADEFKENPDNGLIFSCKYYPDDNHNSSPLIAEYDAFRFLFRYYRLPPETEAALFSTDTKSDVASIIEKHFAGISKSMDYKVLPPEALLDAMGHDYMEINLYPQALAVFTLNAAYYPRSSIVYGSLGDYYKVKNNNVKAAEFYNRSLKIKDSIIIRGKLKDCMASIKN